MYRAVLLIIMGAASAAPLCSQPLSIYSEFQRLDASGEILKVDRFDGPRRELVSPAAARNGWFTFRVSFRVPPGQTGFLYLAQNPDDTAQFKLYREATASDALEPVEAPASDTNSGREPIVRSYLVDMFVPHNAPLGRFRAEIQINLQDVWTIYPMEVRIQSLSIPQHRPQAMSMAPLSARADATVWNAWKNYLCPASPQNSNSQQPAGLSARSLMVRNALQDIALMRLRESEQGRSAVEQTLFAIAGFPPQTPRAQACAATLPPSKRGPEWVLRARDYLVQNLTVTE